MTGPRRSAQLALAASGLLLLGLLGLHGPLGRVHAHGPAAARSRALAALAAELRLRVEQATGRSEQLDLVFLIDASASVGEANFRGELGFARRMLSGLSLGPAATRLSILAFAGKGQLVRHVDHVSLGAGHADKCRLLNGRLDRLEYGGYSGGGTYTHGALLEALAILRRSRGRGARQLLFLVTDGFSNGGDPRRAAALLRALGVTIFSFGIRSGNVQELRDIASRPGHEHSYFLESFAELEALARRASHRGVYAAVDDRAECRPLCRPGPEPCCDPAASCACGTSSGHYACVCPRGYFGSGLAAGCRPCPNGTYGQHSGPDDLTVACVPCPDANHVTLTVPALSQRDCLCTSGFVDVRGACQPITCSKLKVPDNGYFVNANDCNNVVNAACGIRCRIGFQLIGDSIRLCGRDGRWSGAETQCLLKTCAALRAPANGRIKCEHEHANDRDKVGDGAAYPIDTRCQFQCERGFQLRGSRVRNCLPLSRWDGLQASCKRILCEPLKAVANAQIQPESCAGPGKLAYGTNCTVSCRDGYKLEGPKTRVCVGRHGAWSKRHTLSRCIDKTSPVLVCPARLSASTLPGKSYAYVDWPLPNATDNSGVECYVWSKPHLTLPWKAHIGKHTIKYVAQDVSGNRARCAFDVLVVDKEPPVIQNCHGSQLLAKAPASNPKHLSSWIDPIAYDNSGLPVTVSKVLRLAAEPSHVAYTVADEYGNSAKCLVNLTANYTCHDIDVPGPLNGRADCQTGANGAKECLLFCDDGYDFALPDGSPIVQNSRAYVVSCEPNDVSWSALVPDCSPTRAPTAVIQEASLVLTADSVDCDDAIPLSDWAKSINDSYARHYAKLCDGNDVACEIGYEASCTEISRRPTRSGEAGGRGQRARAAKPGRRRRARLELRLRLIARTREGHEVAAGGLGAAIESARLAVPAAKLPGPEPLSLDWTWRAPRVVCAAGSVRSRSQCVECAAGTFHNETRGRCQSCPRGGCRPAEDERPRGCRAGACSNGASCSEHADGFSCDCPERYVGPACRVLVDPCLSSPCSSAGRCAPTERTEGNERTERSYVCHCEPGYSGLFCQSLLDECAHGPCRNAGRCSSTDAGLSCACADGFEGELCELAVDRCERAPCGLNSTCRSVDASWKCICEPGFLGARCDLLPCDWLPCRPGQICVNVPRANANRSSYRCECPRGYAGDDCLAKIDHCANQPCRNNGTCIDRLLHYTCNCQPPFTGSTCQTELRSNYMLHFAKSSTTDYVSLPGPAYNLTELTACFWMQSADTFNYGTVFSYATSSQDNALTLTDYSGFVFYVNGEKIITDIRLNDGQWHFVCVAWENELGSWQFYVDGVQQDNGTLMAKGSQIQANGNFAFGQEQDRVGGGFSESEAFLGKLYLLDIWDRAFDPKVIYDLSNTCQDYHGSLIAWAQLQEGVRGEVQLINSSFCERCPTPVAPFKGIANVSKDGSEVSYSCERGYELRKGYERVRTLKKKCMKHGNWAGSAVPKCARVACPFPEYFLRGQVYGRSHLYGDKIVYNCNDGYRLKGNVERLCTAKGQWTGTTPYCLGITCRNLLAPEHGDFDYIVAEHDRDDLSMLQVGQQLQFKCDVGYALSGNKILTCLQNGTWNFQRPLCLPLSCPPPDRINDVHIVKNISSRLSTTSSLESHSSNNPIANELVYFGGDILTFSCKQGYKFEASYIRLTEFQLECTPNGTWAGLLLNCVPLECPAPIQVENAITYLLNEDQQEINFTNNNTMSVRESYGNVNETTTTRYTLGKQIKITCSKGFEIVQGSTIRTCTENETWTDEDVRCEVLQCPATELNNHPMIKIFLNNTQKSQQQLRLDIIKTFQGEFDFFIQGFNYGHKIIIQCKYHMNRDNLPFKFIWECDEWKKWTFLNESFGENNLTDTLLKEEINVCSLDRCGTLSPPPNGYIDYKNSSENIFEPRVIFKCNLGYRLIGAEKSYCLLNRTWTSIPKCQPIACGGPPKVLHAEVNSSIKIRQSSFGTTIPYQCMTGYRIFGQLKSQCLASGTWSKVNGRCARISCGRPQLTAGASIQGNSYLYQDRLIYVCPNGKFRDFIVCNRDGKWSNLPNCKT